MALCDSDEGAEKATLRGGCDLEKRPADPNTAAEVDPYCQQPPCPTQASEIGDFDIGFCVVIGSSNSGAKIHNNSQFQRFVASVSVSQGQLLRTDGDIQTSAVHLLALSVSGCTHHGQ